MTDIEFWIVTVEDSLSDLEYSEILWADGLTSDEALSEAIKLVRLSGAFDPYFTNNAESTTP